MINNPMKNTCMLFTDPPGGPQVDTEATIQMTVTVQAVADDTIAAGASTSVTSTKANIGLSAAAVNVARSFGQFVAGSATDFSLSLVNGSPATYNVAAAQPGGSIPFAQQPLVASTALNFSVPATGFLLPVGPFTATGAVGANVTADYTSLTAKVQFSDTPSGPTTPYELRCTPNLAVGQTTRLATIPITPPVVTPAPKITSLDPNTGFTTGGDFVQINGTDLDLATGVTVDGVDVAFDNNGDGTLSFITPESLPLNAGKTVQVRVVGPAGPSADNGTADDFIYTVPPPVPTITSIVPNNGPTAGGNVITINGTDLGGALGVIFGDFALGTNLVQVSNSQIKVTVPAATADGVVNVAVATNGGISLDTPADDYTYGPVAVPAPTVSSISPTSGPAAGGTVVTITGTNLGSPTGVKFGTVAGTAVTAVSATQVKATAPAGTGIVDVTVTTAGGTSATSAADKYTYVVPAPTVTGIAPTTGPIAGGTVVTITGTNLTGATGVKFGANAATAVTPVSATQVKATSPAGAVGAVDVTVTTAGGTSATSAADKFTYFVPAPIVSSITPTTGLTTGGTVVTVNGQNLSNATAVKFGATAGTSVTPVSDTQLKVTSPAGAAGAVDVTVTTAGGTSATSAADKFTYVPPAPTVTGIAPTSGSTAGGTVVTITGTNLTGATGVKFGTVAGTAITVVSATQVKATSPAGAAGAVDVTVTTAGGTSATSAADKFTYVTPVPVITSLSPTSGPTTGGTVVTITGTDLAGVTSVKFGTLAGTSLTQVSGTQVKATAPAQAAGAVAVTVTTAGGTSASATYTYNTVVVPGPVITNLTPNSGPVAGGTVVTINGTNLAGTTSVKFGTVAATAVTQVSATQVKATSPAGTGTVGVTVTNGVGTSAPVNFTYTTVSALAPKITKVFPNVVLARVGGVVTLTGVNFVKVTAVKYGTRNATFFQVGNSLVTVAPALAPGTYPITVVTAAGPSPASAVARLTYVGF